MLLLFVLTLSCSSDDDSSEVCAPEEVEICLMPTNISVSNINLTTADISWNSMDNHIGTELEYGLFGFQLSSGAVINTSNQFITLTDLIPNTRYSV